MPYDHKIFFDYVRDNPFHGLDQSQVDGMEAVLTVWEKYLDGQDPRWLAYMYATTYHETSQEMLPIEEYGHGEGQPYGEKDPETGQTYFGRGFVQTTWRENYRRSDQELAALGMDTEGDKNSEWNAERQLDPVVAAATMYVGMRDGWFRSDEDGKQTLERYFSGEKDDPYGAREIINGDKTKVPGWSNGVSIGNLIKGYHKAFLAALEASRIKDPAPQPEPSPETPKHVEVAITADEGVSVSVKVNGDDFDASPATS